MSNEFEEKLKKILRDCAYCDDCYFSSEPDEFVKRVRMLIKESLPKKKPFNNDMFLREQYFIEGKNSAIQEMENKLGVEG